MNTQEALKVMQHGSHSEKMGYLYDLDAEFDTYNRNIANSSEVITALIGFALSSKDDELINEILGVISSAQVSQDLKEVDFHKLAEKINSIPVKFLPLCIDILGATADVSHLPVILNFKHHGDTKVQEAVRDALVELRVPEPD